MFSSPSSSTTNANSSIRVNVPLDCSSMTLNEFNQEYCNCEGNERTLNVFPRPVPGKLNLKLMIIIKS